jgi:hypothetical protein
LTADNSTNFTRVILAVVLEIFGDVPVLAVRPKHWGVIAWPYRQVIKDWM